MSITDERLTTLSKEKRLMVKRIQNWINTPESDPELLKIIIESGHLEDLKMFLKNGTDKETYSRKTSNPFGVCKSNE